MEKIGENFCFDISGIPAEIFKVIVECFPNEIIAGITFAIPVGILKRTFWTLKEMLDIWRSSKCHLWRIFENIFLESLQKEYFKELPFKAFKSLLKKNGLFILEIPLTIFEKKNI